MEKWKKCEEIVKCKIDKRIGLPTDSDMKHNEEYFHTLDIDKLTLQVKARVEKEFNRGKQDSEKISLGDIKIFPTPASEFVKNGYSIFTRGLANGKRRSVMLNAGMISTNKALEEVLYHELRHFTGHKEDYSVGEGEKYVRALVTRKHMEDHGFSLDKDGLIALRKSLGIPEGDLSLHEIHYNYIQKREQFRETGKANVLTALLLDFFMKDNELLGYFVQYSSLPTNTQDKLLRLKKEYTQNA